MTESSSETSIDAGQKKAEETASAFKDRAGSLKDEAKRTAADMAKGARNRVESEVTARGEAARDQVATAVEDTAETLRTAAERMSDGTPQSEAVNRAANTVYGVAEQIRTTDPQAAVETVTTFARRHPAAFLAGAALAGFAAGRFVKSSARPEMRSGGSFDHPAPAPVRSAPTPPVPPAPQAAPTPRPGRPAGTEV